MLCHAIPHVFSIFKPYHAMLYGVYHVNIPHRHITTAGTLELASLNFILFPGGLTTRTRNAKNSFRLRDRLSRDLQATVPEKRSSACHGIGEARSDVTMTVTLVLALKSVNRLDIVSGLGPSWARWKRFTERERDFTCLRSS